MLTLDEYTIDIYCVHVIVIAEPKDKASNPVALSSPHIYLRTYGIKRQNRLKFDRLLEVMIMSPTKFFLTWTCNQNGGD